MGRIKSTMIKKAARQLLEGEHKFTDSFEHNKQMLKRSLPSKPIENKVAGYIARLVRMKAAEKVKLAKLASMPKPLVNEESQEN
jgi:ribosomal protein S17E